MAFCGECGIYIEENMRFCPYCGKAVKGELAEAHIDLKVVTCPNCQANVPYNGESDMLICKFCDTEFVIDDKATELNRILRAQSEAKKRDTDIAMEYELQQQTLELKNQAIRFALANPIFCIAIVLLLLFNFIRIIGGDFAPADILFDALILYFTYRITNMKTKD